MKPKEELLINAIHEAGHAAACLNLELPFGDVYLDRPKGDAGIVAGLVRSTDIDYSSGVLTPEEESTSTYMVIAALAGPACEALHYGHVAFDITEYEDLDAVLDIIEYRFANNNVRMAFARYCEAEAFALFQDDRRLWRYANVLARELMREKKLTYAQCAELYNKEYLVESWVRKEVEEIRRMGGEATSVEARVEGKEKGQRDKGQGPRPKAQEERGKEQAAGDEQRAGKEVADLVPGGVEGALQPAEAQDEERRGKRRRGRRRGGRRRGKGAREELRTEGLEGEQLPGEIEQLPGEIISSTQQPATAGQPPVPVQEGGTPKPREVPKQQREGVSERPEPASPRPQAASGEERPRLQVIKKQPAESKEGALSDTEQDKKAIGTQEQGTRAEQPAATIQPKEAEARKQEPAITPAETGLPEIKPEEARPAAAGAAKRRPIGKAASKERQGTGNKTQAAGGAIEHPAQEGIKAPGGQAKQTKEAAPVAAAPGAGAVTPVEQQPATKAARGRGGAKAGKEKPVVQEPQARPEVPATQGRTQKQSPGKGKEEGKANVLEATGMKTTGVKAQGRAVQGTRAAHPDSIWEEEKKEQGSREKVQGTRSKAQGSGGKVQETKPKAQEAKGKVQPGSGEKKEAPKPVKAAKPRAAKAAKAAPAKPAPLKGAARAAAPPAKKAAPKKAAPKKK